MVVIEALMHGVDDGALLPRFWWLSMSLTCKMCFSLTPHCCVFYDALSSHGSWTHHNSCCCGPFNSNLPRSKLSGNRKPSFLYLSAPTKTITGTLSVLRSLDTTLFCLSIFSSIVLKHARGNVHRVKLGEVRLISYRVTYDGETQLASLLLYNAANVDDLVWLVLVAWHLT